MTSVREVDGVDVASVATESDGRSAVAIVASLWEKVESLVQLEMKLGLAEAEEKLESIRRELVAKALAGSVAFAAMLTLVTAFVALLALVMKVWLAALFTGTALSVAAFLLLRRELTASAPTTKETSHGT